MSLMAKKSPKKKKVQIPNRYHVKKGDTVMVIAGREQDKGKTGVVKKVLRDRGKVIVEGLNIVKKAVRPNPMLGDRGGIIEMEAPIPVSKVMVYDAKAGKPTRVKRETIQADGKDKRVRVSVKSGEQLDA